jgi:thiol-disulfide isomerase/thioredoxin
MWQFECGAVALAVLTAVAAGPAAASPKHPRAVVGEPAPPFTATTFDGRRIALSDLRGKVVILNYWATWCGPCKIEMPVMDAWLRAHPDADVEVLAITTEGSVPARTLKPLAAALSFPLISKLSGYGYGKVDDAVPTNYVIDRAGVLREAKAGAFSARAFDSMLTRLLSEPKPAG